MKSSNDWLLKVIDWSMPYDPVGGEKSEVSSIIVEVLNGRWPFADVLLHPNTYELECELFTSGRCLGPLKLIFSTVAVEAICIPEEITKFCCHSDVAPPPSDLIQSGDLHIRLRKGAKAIPSVVEPVRDELEVVHPARRFYEEAMKSLWGPGQS